jgi:hypothetical protein
MTRKSCRPGHLLLLLVVAAFVAHAFRVDSGLMAQAQGDIAALRTQLDRRFDVLPLQDGVLLRPRARINDVRSIEVHQGSIALDGLVVTGAELRQRLGADADMVVRVSYLSPADQRTLTGAEQPGTAAPAAGAITPPLLPEPLEPREAAREARERAREAREAARDARERARDAARGRFGRRGGPGDRVRFGGTVTVNEGETVDGDVVVIAGTARINGRVNGEVVVVAGTAELGPKADIAEDVVVVGGPLRRDPAARIGGDVDEIGFGPININPNVRMPPFGFGSWNNWGNPFGSAFSLLATVIRVAVMCLLVALVLLFGSSYVDRIRAFAASEPFKAGAVGFLSQVLMLPLTVILVIVLVITIVGIPLLLLLPFVLLALCVLGLVGFTAVARQVGDLVVGRFSDGGIGVYAATMAGVLLIVSPLLLGRLISMGGGPLWLVSTPLAAVGFFVEYAAWTIGFGAVLFSTFGRRLPMTAPPPLP